MDSPMPGRYSTMRNRQQTQCPIPQSCFVGDTTVPWNVGETVFRLKAARDLTLTDITIDVKEIVSPSGNPVVIEAWKNGVYSGDQAITHGAICFDDKNIQLKKLDEIELRLVVKGIGDAHTEVKELWFLYCIE